MRKGRATGENLRPKTKEKFWPRWLIYYWLVLMLTIHLVSHYFYFVTIYEALKASGWMLGLSLGLVIFIVWLLRRKKIQPPATLSLTPLQVFAGLFILFCLTILLINPWADLSGAGLALRWAGLVRAIKICTLPSLITFWVTIFLYGLGAKILKKIYPKQPQGFLEKGLLGLGLGIALFIGLMFFLGIFGLYYPWLAWAILIGGTLVCRKEIIQLCIWLARKKVRWSIYAPHNPIHNLHSLLIVLAMVFLVLSFIVRFSPEPSDFDSLFIYLAFPHTYTQEHRLVLYPYNFFDLLGHGGEMLTTFFLLLSNIHTASVWSLFQLILIFLALILNARLFHPAHRGPQQIIFLWSIFFVPMVWHIATECFKIDGLLGLFFLLALFALLRFQEKKENPWLFLLAIFAGTAISIKYTAVFYAIVFGLILIWILRRQKGALLGKTALYFLLVLLICSPWLVRNYRHFGNLLAPLFLERLNSGQIYYNALELRSYQYYLQGFADEAKILHYDRENKNLLFYLSLPWKIQAQWQVQKEEGANPGAIFFAFIFLIFHPKSYRKQKRAWQILFFILLASAILLCTVFATRVRYVLPALLVLLLVYQINVRFFPQKIQKTILGALVAYNLLLFFTNLGHLNLWLLDTQGKQKAPLYLTSLKNASVYLNEHVTGNDLILGINEPRSYYIQAAHTRYIPNWMYETISYAVQENLSFEETKMLFNRLGVQTFVFNQYFDYYFSEGAAPTVRERSPETYQRQQKKRAYFQNFAALYLKTVYAQDGIIIYQMK